MTKMYILYCQYDYLFRKTFQFIPVNKNKPKLLSLFFIMSSLELLRKIINVIFIASDTVFQEISNVDHPPCLGYRIYSKCRWPQFEILIKAKNWAAQIKHQFLFVSIHVGICSVLITMLQYAPYPNILCTMAWRQLQTFLIFPFFPLSRDSVEHPRQYFVECGNSFR